MPGRLTAGRRRLPASYANFYVGNAAVLLPVYGPPARDAQALRVLRRAFPGRRVVPIDARALVYGYGSIHCVTQQQPA
jgi:agmatine deiminase